MKKLIDWKTMCAFCRLRCIAIDDSGSEPCVVVTCSKFSNSVVKAAPDICFIWKQLETDENA